MDNKQHEGAKITRRVPTEIAETMKRLARDHARSLNGELVWAIQEYIARQRQKQAR
jgi:hypothetical protein